MTQYVIIFVKFQDTFFAEAGGCETDTFQTEEKNCECYNAKQIEVNLDNKADKDVVRKTKDKLLPRWKKPKRPKWWEEKL